ncbi:MAG: RNA pseudouridine synthase [Robiginitomaculum sp.]|nr:MAG: RNA pseudouridine synthase [Robiginitomaculum sp.]PHS75889.1 MAG: RNA pseudouridine synthase [Robiginitomaculum sp.]
MSGVQNITVDEGDDGSRLDRWFKRKFPHIPHGRVEKYLRTGQLRVEGKRVKGKVRLEAGQNVRVPPLPEPGDKKPARRMSDADINFMKNMVIYEDNDLIALNKPAGLAVQGGTNTTRHIDGMLLALAYKGTPPRLVHRLDKDTSGVLVVAKNAKSAAWLGKAFQNRSTKKIYWGITQGVPRPATGEVKGYVAKGEGFDGREVMMAVRHGTPGAKHARTLYQVASSAGNRAAWVVMQPLSGRKHQLRLHMHLLETPLAFDPKYTSDKEELGGLAPQLHLHAKSLTLPHPDGHTIELHAALSAHMQNAFDLFGFDENMTIEEMEP